MALALLRSPLPAYAHFQATTGNLTAILHIEPDDNPTVGQAENLYLIFDDSAHQFRLADCTCSLSISRDGMTLSSNLLQPPYSHDTVYDTAAIPFTFNQAGAYQITLTGRPSSPGAFKSFELKWSPQIGQAAEPPGDSRSTLLKYLAIIVGILLILGLIVFLPL